MSRKYLPLLLLVAAYFATRLHNLTLLPIFTDESIYLFWAKTIATTNSQFFISLTDGKPPLLIWAITLLLKILPSDWYLVAGRLPSVFAGFLGLLAMYGLAKELFHSKAASIIASLLLIISPFILIYDRLALFDGMLSSFILCSVYFAVRTGRHLRITDALLWGGFLAAAFLSKPTAVIFVLLTPLVALAVADLTKKKLIRLGLLTLLALGIGEGVNNIQRLSSVYYLMEGKNAQFQQPISELIKNPLALTWGNLQAFFRWNMAYYTWPFALAGVASFAYLFVKKWKIAFVLLLIWLVPIFIMATVGKIIFPRYVLFSSPYLLLPIAYLATSLKKVGYVVLGIVLIPQLILSYNILTNPPAANLPEADYRQYITEHTSGYGLDKVFAYLDDKKQTGKITVVTQGTFGLYPYAFNLQYWDDTNVNIIPRWPLSVIDQDIYDATRSSNVYIIFKEENGVPSDTPVQTLLKVDKPGNIYPIYLTAPNK